jgi:putative membrane protein
MLYSVLHHGGAEAGSIWEWTLDPSILIGTLVWIALYALVNGPLQKKGGWQRARIGQQVSFFAGTLIAFLALTSPLDHISDEYLFSAHMLQHLLLMMVAPPLWLIGLPDGLVDRLVQPGRIQFTLRWVLHPVGAFLIYNLVFWIWHIPSLYQAALENENIHILEHLFFIVAGLISWWPMAGRSQKALPLAGYPIRMVYVFLMMFPMTLLAALITFAKQSFYPFYNQAPRLWGLSVIDDQQLAGLIMWIPGNLIFFTAFASTFFNWFKSQETAEGPEPANSLVETERRTVEIR